MNKMEIIDEILESCQYDENYELDDVIEKLEEFKSLVRILNKKDKLPTNVKVCCLCDANFSPSKQLPNDAICNKCHKELRGY